MKFCYHLECYSVVFGLHHFIVYSALKDVKVVHFRIYRKSNNSLRTNSHENVNLYISF